MQAVPPSSLVRLCSAGRFIGRLRPNVRAAISSAPPKFSTCASTFNDHEFRRISIPSEFYLERSTLEEPIFLKRFTIPPPSEHEHDPNRWANTLTSLRAQAADESARPVDSNPTNSDLKVYSTVLDVSQLLCEVQNEDGIDLLSYLGVQNGRWSDVSWVVRVVSNQDFRLPWKPDNIIREGVLSISESERRSLNEITESALELPLQAEGSPIAPPPWILDSHPAPLFRTIQRGALGQVWRSLGNMVLTASTLPELESRDIMDHVLDTLAILHHNGVVPERAYQFSEAPDYSALTHPPLLHYLSQYILMAILDAEWNMFQKDSPDVSPYLSAAQFKIPGFDFPKTRNPKQIIPYVHELWLEYILWMCLQGGWVYDGMAVLQKILDPSRDQRWSALSWDDMVVGDQHWSEVIWDDVMSGNQEICRIPERTLSSQLISSYVDGLLNRSRVGVGGRGLYGPDVLRYLSDIKDFLAQSRSQLQALTWDRVVVRTVDSGAVGIENNTQLPFQLLSLAKPERDSAASSQDRHSSSTLDNAMEPSSAVLGLYHRLLHFHADSGHFRRIWDTLTAMEHRNGHDTNKSISNDSVSVPRPYSTSEIGNMHNTEDDERDTSPPDDKPNQDMSKLGLSPIPGRTLAKLIESIANPKLFGLVWGKALNIPEGKSAQIPSHIYSDPQLAPSFIRYAVANSDKAMLETVMLANAPAGHSLRLPLPILIALLKAQVENRNWITVENTLQTIGLKHRQLNWYPRVIAAVAKEILRLQSNSTPSSGPSSRESLSRALQIFRKLVREDYSRHTIYRPMSDEIHSILGVLSSINRPWNEFCRGLFQGSGSRPLALAQRDFQIILEGVMETLDTSVVRRVWETWCQNPKPTWLPAPELLGSAPTMPIKPSSRADGYFDENKWVVLKADVEEEYVFRGRVVPDIQLLRSVMRGVAASPRSDVNDRDWILGQLTLLGLDEDEVKAELEQAELPQAEVFKDAILRSSSSAELKF